MAKSNKLISNYTSYGRINYVQIIHAIDTIFSDHSVGFDLISFLFFVFFCRFIATLQFNSRFLQLN